MNNQFTYANVKEIYERLSSNRADSSSINSVRVSGVYALFVQSSDCPLPGITFSEDGLLYIGSTSNLRSRNHFQVKHSGRNSPRRSLGATLKSELGLTAIHGQKRNGEPSCTNFGFVDDGESRLSEWMRQHLCYSGHQFTGDYRRLECCLIDMYCPPLNLTNLKNPHRAEIRHLREVCADEARVRLAQLQ